MSDKRFFMIQGFLVSTGSWPLVRKADKSISFSSEKIGCNGVVSRSFQAFIEVYESGQAEGYFINGPFEGPGLSKLAEIAFDPEKKLEFKKMPKAGESRDQEAIFEIFNFSDSRCPMWEGSWSDRATGEGLVRCLVQEIPEEFFLPPLDFEFRRSV